MSKKLVQLSDIYTYLLTDKQIDLILFIATKLDVCSFFVLRDFLRHKTTLTGIT